MIPLAQDELDETAFGELVLETVAAIRCCNYLRVCESCIGVNRMAGKASKKSSK